jgi:putative MATE family efflux protein
VSAAAAAGASPVTLRMLAEPVLPTLLRLAAPNIVGLFAITLVIGYDGYIVGRLGADALAGVALVLPLAMLMLQMSAGGLGGATTAAVARARGAGDAALASRLATHALLLGLAASVLFTLVAAQPAVYALLGGRDGALDQAARYATVLFGGAVAIWSVNVLAGVARGAGEMLPAALALLGTTALHLVLCPVLVFGFGPVPALGVAGAAASTVTSNGLAALGLLAWITRPRSALRLGSAAWRLQSGAFRNLLRVGLPASLNPVISNASVALATAFIGSYGSLALAGFGVAARLEYILVPIAFGVGSALTAMVATNMGAGQTARAKRIAWTGAGLVLAITGTIGAAAALWPGAWMGLFTTDAAVVQAGSGYLRIVGGFYGFFGLGLALFFASQGAGRMAWPLVASGTRLAVVAVGGWLCVHFLQLPAAALFVVVAGSFAAYGLTLALAVRRSDWSRKETDNVVRPRVLAPR